VGTLFEKALKPDLKPVGIAARENSETIQ